MEANMKRITIALVAALLSLSSALADDAHHKQAPLAQGEIRKVDKAAGKITLKHGPIPSIDMPAMTMAYQIKDAKMLGSLKAGDKVLFQAEKLGDAYTVTRIELAR
jgi:Cu(I)/Ag(I) efflux system protein CusF